MLDILSKIGQLFIIGFPGVEPSQAFLNFLKEEQIGGIILFAENCPTHLVVRDTIQRLNQSFKDSQPFIAIDQEGGRVCRLHGVPAEIRSAEYWGRNNNIEGFREVYERAALFMDSLGINLNLFPVCDLALEKDNICLRDRCYGADPVHVAEFVTTAVETSRANGLLSCLKHFPGLGAARIDPHVQTAEADYDEMIWEQREQIPFKAGIDAGAEFVMTTHMRIPKLDEKVVTVSEKIISKLLRTELSFDGPLITDDLTMKGAESLGTIGERTVAAFNAGHDLLLFGQDFEQSARAYDYFIEAYKRGEVELSRLNTALERVAGIKFKLDSSVLR